MREQDFFKAVIIFAKLIKYWDGKSTCSVQINDAYINATNSKAVEYAREFVQDYNKTVLNTEKQAHIGIYYNRMFVLHHPTDVVPDW